MNRKNTLVTFAIACLMITVSFVVLASSVPEQVSSVQMDDASTPENNVIPSSQQGELKSFNVDMSLDALALSSYQAIEDEIISIDISINGDRTQDSSWVGSGVIIDIGGTGEDLHITSPCVLKLDDGSYVMWYNGDGDDGLTYRHRIFRATSQDGLTWQKQGMVLDYGNAYEQYGVLTPYVIIDDDGIYHMWYTGIGSNGGYRAYIHKAISYDDGITWQKLGMELNYGTAADPDGVRSPYVHYDGTEWHMWYDGIDWGSPNEGRICHAHKAKLSDAWIKDGVVINNDGPYDYPSAVSPWIVPTDTGYDMYYTGSIPYTGPSRILHATSSDGIAWTKTGIVLEGITPLETTMVGMGQISIEGDTIKCWYTGYDGSHQRIFYSEKPAAKIGQDATCTVSIYLDSVSEANLIDRQTNAFVPADSNTPVSFDWIAVPGDHDIIAEITDSDPIDNDNTNNMAITQISVEALPEPSVGVDISLDPLVLSSDQAIENDIINIDVDILGDQSQSSSWVKSGVIIDIGGTGEDLHVTNPCVLKLDDGSYVMWYNGDGDDGLTYRHRIFRATSQDGITWQKQGLALDYGNAYEQYGVLTPYVMIDDDGIYHMWYTGIGSYGGYRGYIHRAISYDDGLTWQKLGMELSYGTAADPDGVTVPFVHYDGTEWHMWYGGTDWGSPNEGRICHAHKAQLSDPWIKDGVVINNDGPYDYPTASYPQVIVTDTGYEMYYTGYAPYTGPSRILHATSTDGITWIKTGIVLEGSLPLETNMVAAAYMMTEGDTLKCWYNGYDGSNVRIFYAEKPAAKIGQDATCTVSFYIDTISEVTLIDRQYDVFVPADGTVTVSTSWLADQPGDHSIIAVASDVVPGDIDLTNNQANGQISIIPYIPSNESPIADAGADIFVDVGANAEFNGNSSYDPDGSIISYFWDFGDGQTDFGMAVYHIYSTPGSFTATLTVTDDGGLTSSDVCEVVVTEPYVPVPPIANAGLDIIVDIYTDTQFDGSGSYDPDGAIVSYSWDFGDGYTASGPVPMHSFDAVDIYSVTLTVTDDDGLTVSDECLVEVIDPYVPILPISDAGLDQEACLNIDVQFDGSGSYDPDGSIVSYNWDFGDGTYGTGIAPAHDYASTGNFTVILTVIDNDGLVASDECQITVFEPVQPPEDPPIGGKLSIDKIKTSGPDEVFTHTKYGWVLQITVANTGDSDVLDVVVHDVLPAELELIDFTITTGVLIYGPNGVGQVGSTSLTWNIGTMAADEIHTLELVISTKPNPAGKQEFTSPGTYSLNDGAWVSGNDAITGEGSLVGPTPMITVIAIDGGEQEDDTNLLPSLAITTQPDILTIRSSDDEAEDEAGIEPLDLETGQVENSKSQKNSVSSYAGLFLMGLVIIVLVSSTLITSEAKKKKGKTGDADMADLNDLDKKLISGEITEEEYIKEMKKKI